MRGVEVGRSFRRFLRDFAKPSGSLSLLAGGGDDTVTLAGADALLTVPVAVFGDAGNDTLLGGSNYDVLLGGLGDDSLYGGLGTDTLAGNDGEDVIVGLSSE